MTTIQKTPTKSTISACITLLLALMLASTSLLAQALPSSMSPSTAPPIQGVIVRTSLGLSGLQSLCLLEGCTVVRNLDGSQNQLFLVTPQNGLLPNLLGAALSIASGIIDAEVDQSVSLFSPSDSAQASTPPSGLWDSTPVTYYGTVVPNGYVNQPATGIVRLAQAQTTFNVSGSGVIADIDTGVDPNHPALQGALLPGYDFTRNQPGGSELNDVSGTEGGSCDASADPCSAAYVNQQTVAMLDQHTAAMMDGTGYSDFGHGTMVAGILHLVAPTAQIMPLKSFRADGTANLSDILRAIYYATNNNANVINMSFNLTSPSQELGTAVNYATNKNVVCVASSGNDGAEEIVYPAALQNVMGAASTNDSDQRSSFSNYGDRIVWVAAPGEAIVTTYPFGYYAAGWGTSFSSPFVAGTAALVLNALPAQNQLVTSWAIGHAKYIGPNMGAGRLDIYQALSTFNPAISLLY